MGTIQSNIAAYNVIETRLRRAAEENQPISVRDLYSIPDVANVVRGMQQVRDTVMTLAGKKMALKLPISGKAGDKSSRVGFMWNRNYEGQGFVPKEHIERKHGKVVRHSFPKEVPEVIRKPTEIEFEFQGVVIVVSKNEETGRIRLTIEG